MGTQAYCNSETNSETEMSSSNKSENREILSLLDLVDLDKNDYLLGKHKVKPHLLNMPEVVQIASDCPHQNVQKTDLKVPDLSHFGDIHIRYIAFNMPTTTNITTFPL